MKKIDQYIYKFLIASFLLASASCGVKKEDSKFTLIKASILNGEDSSLSISPWQISLWKRGRHFCSGAVISRRYILTAAHCVKDKKAHNYTVRGGGTGSLSDLRLQPKIVEIILHPNYRGWVNGVKHADIALLRLQSDIDLPIISLPTSNIEEDIESESYGDIFITGWGFNEQGEIPEQLQLLSNLELIPGAKSSFWKKRKNRKVLKKSDYSRYEQNNYKTYKKGEYLGFYNIDQKAACGGDSGGPMIRSDRDELIGLTSHSSHKKCHDSKISYYTNVYFFLDWIYENID